MNGIRALLTVAVMLFGAVSAHAQGIPGQGTWETTLQARDVGNTGTTNAFYDTVLGITWLRDANVNGLMDWNTAMSWASTLTVGGVGGWRLPNMTNSLPGDSGAYSSSEMASLFFDSLGNRTNPNVYLLSNTGRFQNVQDYAYWSSLEYATSTDNAWDFNIHFGSQQTYFKSNEFYAMAVHPGDVGTVVASVPEPETYAMLLAGLGLIGAVARRRHSDMCLTARS